MTEEPAPSTGSADIIGCFGATAAGMVIPPLAIMIIISSPTLTPTFTKVWDWTALGLAVSNFLIGLSLMRGFGRSRVLWLIGSSAAIILTCPHFWW